MMVVLVISATAGVFLPQGSFSFIAPDQPDQMMSKNIIALSTAAMILVIYGGLGLLGLRFCRKLNFSDMWPQDVPAKKKILLPIIWGVSIGLFFIMADLIFSRLHPLVRA